MRMDLLKDWIGILEHEYRLARVDNRRERRARVKAILKNRKGEKYDK